MGFRGIQKKKVQMDKVRKGEIALKVVGYYLRKRGFEMTEHRLREAPNIAKELGIEVEELREFAHSVLTEQLDTLLQPKPSECANPQLSG